MDKKKVTELIFKAHHYIEEVFHRQADNNNAIDAMSLANASVILLTAISELSKSDWVSVEDGLPPYNENVEVCSKVKPTEVWIDSRDKYIDVGNSFRYNKLYGNIITHWKPIDKLEE